MFLLVFIFLYLDSVLLLKLLESQWVGHQGLVSGLFLLLDGEKRVLSDFGGSISHSICELDGNKVLVRSTDLWTWISNRVVGTKQQSHLVVLVPCEDLINPLLA